MDKVVQAATVIAAFFLLLGIFHSPCQVHHELLHDTFDTFRVLTIYSFTLIGTLPFHMCQVYGLGRVPWSLPFWLPSWLTDSQSTSSPVGWPSGRPPWP